MTDLPEVGAAASASGDVVFGGRNSERELDPPSAPGSNRARGRWLFFATDALASLGLIIALGVMLATGGGIAERAWSVAALALLLTVGATALRLWAAVALRRDPLHTPVLPAILWVGGAGFIVWVGASLVPIPEWLLRQLSPEGARWWGMFAPTSGVSPRLSVDPQATIRALSELLLWAGVAASAAVWASRRPRRMALVGLLLLVGLAGGAIGVWKLTRPRMPGEHFAGPLANRNHFADMMAMLAPLAAGVATRAILRAQRAAARLNAIYGLSDALSSRLVLLMLVPIIFAGAALLSLSRSGAAAVAFGLVVWMLLAIPRSRDSTAVHRGGMFAGRGLLLRTAIAMALAAAVAFFVLGLEPLADRWGRVGEEFDASHAGSRGQIWSDTWRIAADFPLTGGGLGSFYGLYLPYASAPTTRVPIYAHQEYLQLLAETGVPGTALALMAIAGIALAGWRKIAAAGSSPDRALYAGILAGLLAMALQSLAEFSLRIPLNAAVAALLIGLLLHDAAPHDAGGHRAR